ncbi:MAG TPA: cell division protein ZapA [Bacteroidales bacterium]|nr:cell division protein ZapA [Bacteroidales bacterium]HNX07885.1 cell division protein ZapA [Bacteroidales bacterium]HPB25427.1 cell division protein ZapA [Bacteroidales bacterium]HPS27488.1 cell division protein ZapA [Bacteroidales bacterium]HQN16102.1 cell division protein ZapA [Bacteroidales bacterium]
MEEFSISVVIADRNYRLTIARQEEEIVRKAARTINDKIKEFANNYTFKDKQDLLAMIALQYTSNALNLEQSNVYKDTKLKDKLLELDKVLEQNLVNQ